MFPLLVDLGNGVVRFGDGLLGFGKMLILILSYDMSKKRSAADVIIYVIVWAKRQH